MKGADQCPKCGSRKWGDVRQDVTTFYAPILRTCVNCRTTWEPFDPTDLLDNDDPTSSFREPCNNCAFRPGSNEQRDKARWAEIIEQLGLDKGGKFFCHKGVPIDLQHETPSDSGFAYPVKSVDTPVEGVTRPVYDLKKMRLCRGFLRMMNTELSRKFPAEKDPAA